VSLAPEELVDALVVDSEGYIYGYVDSVTVKEGKFALKVYIKKATTQSVADVEALKTVLLGTVKKMIGKPTMDDLYRKIMKDTGAKAINDDVLIKYATQRNIPVPKKDVPTFAHEEKEIIPWDKIASMDRTDIGVCILLKEPLEADLRGINIQKEIPHRTYHELGAMTVIDSTGKIVGVVAGLKFDVKGPALQLKKQTQVRQNIVDIAELEGILIARTNMPREKLYDQIRASFNLANVSAVTSEHITSWARSGGYTIPTKEVVQMKDVHYTFTVPWERIKKLGEVILLDKPIEELA